MGRSRRTTFDSLRNLGTSARPLVGIGLTLTGRSCQAFAFISRAPFNCLNSHISHSIRIGFGLIFQVPSLSPLSFDTIHLNRRQTLPSLLSNHPSRVCRPWPSQAHPSIRPPTSIPILLPPMQNPRGLSDEDQSRKSRLSRYNTYLKRVSMCTRGYTAWSSFGRVSLTEQA